MRIVNNNSEFKLSQLNLLKKKNSMSNEEDINAVQRCGYAWKYRCRSFWVKTWESFYILTLQEKCKKASMIIGVPSAVAMFFFGLACAIVCVQETPCVRPDGSLKWELIAFIVFSAICIAIAIGWGIYGICKACSYCSERNNELYQQEMGRQNLDATQQ